MSIRKEELRELQKAAMKACKKVAKYIKEEPSTVIIYGSEDGEPERIVDEINAWLFHRRQDDGRSGN